MAADVRGVPSVDFQEGRVDKSWTFTTDVLLAPRGPALLRGFFFKRHFGESHQTFFFFYLACSCSSAESRFHLEVLFL